MSGYSHAKEITVCNEPAKKPKGTKWRKVGAPYMVRSEAMGLGVTVHSADSLPAARRIAKAILQSRKSTWAEIFRWAEGAEIIKAVYVASYERVLVVV